MVRRAHAGLVEEEVYGEITVPIPHEWYAKVPHEWGIEGSHEEDRAHCLTDSYEKRRGKPSAQPVASPPFSLASL